MEKIQFPITHCPNCKNDRFKINANLSGVIELTYNANGELIDSKQKTINVGKLRKQWVCTNCYWDVFTSDQCSNKTN